ncbi:MAG: hypothetical protein AAFR81_19355 [Chloroflexota bacterium]
MFTRQLGKSDIEVSAIGIGTWAIGGVIVGTDGNAHSWGVAMIKKEALYNFPSEDEQFKVSENNCATFL